MSLRKIRHIFGIRNPIEVFIYFFFVFRSGKDIGIFKKQSENMRSAILLETDLLHNSQEIYS